MQSLKINRVDVEKFDSMTEFVNFITNTPFNKVFENETKQSIDCDYRFSGTHSFSEAMDLLAHGSDDLSKKLEQRFQLTAKSFGERTTVKNYYDVCGFQASVPRYLQGIPTSMVNQRKVPMKQKVITLNKNMAYSQDISKEQIIDESIKALALVKELELKGIRVNVNLVECATKLSQTVACKIRIKNANERLNISKMAFAMAHPSMLRRILLRWLEVNPDLTEKAFTWGYGMPVPVKIVEEKGEFSIPDQLNNKQDFIKSLNIL